MVMRRSQITGEILEYLVGHPDAQDTLEGIAYWWLLEQSIINQVALVREALEKLVKAGWVLEVKGADSRIHYRINSGKKKDVKTFLSKHRLKSSRK